MTRMIVRSFFWGAGCLALAFVTVPAHAQQTITFISATTSSNYSNSGLDIGNAGFWFANFNAPAPVSGAALDANAASALPAWVTVNPVPNTTFASTASTKGGQPTWATLTLPDGTSGLSGAVVDSMSANNSSNTIRQLDLGPGTPSSFFFYVVTDNTAGEHDSTNRLRVRADSPPGTEVAQGPTTPAGLAANFNSSPDVYKFRLDGFASGSAIKLQLNSGVAAEQASIAGFMFDNVPEPASGLLLAMAGMGLASAARRRRT